MGSAAGDAKSWVWPVGIAVVLSLHALMCLVFVFVATRDPSVAVEPDYYQKSLRWDETARKRRIAETLGWSVQVEIAPQPSIIGQRSLVCTVTSRGGQAVQGARIDVEAFHHARSAERLRFQLREDAPGVYSARPRMRRSGLWELRLAVEHPEGTFSKTVLANVGAPPRSES